MEGSPVGFSYDEREGKIYQFHNVQSWSKTLGTLSSVHDPLASYRKCPCFPHPLKMLRSGVESND